MYGSVRQPRSPMNKSINQSYEHGEPVIMTRAADLYLNSPLTVGKLFNIREHHMAGVPILGHIFGVYEGRPLCYCPCRRGAVDVSQRYR